MSGGTTVARPPESPRCERILEGLTAEERDIAQTAVLHCNDGVADRGTMLRVAAMTMRLLRERNAA